MTLAELIAYVDNIRPNAFDKDVMTGWVNTIERQVYDQILSRAADYTGDTYGPYQYDLDAFESCRSSCSSCALAVLCPSHPADILCMDSVLDIVVVRYLTVELDADSLKSLGFTLGSAHLAVIAPALPAVILYMCLVLDSA